MYAIINSDNIVINTIIADESFVNEFINNKFQKAVFAEQNETDSTLFAEIGELYINERFVNANEAVDLGYMTVEEAKLVPFGDMWKYKEPKIEFPNSISKLQAKLQLLEVGLLDKAEDIIKQDRTAEIYWTDSQNFYRNDPILLGIAAALNLTDTQLDELFMEASKL